MARWLPDAFDAAAHNARVRSLRSAMREQDAAHRVATDQRAKAATDPKPCPSRQGTGPIAKDGPSDPLGGAASSAPLRSGPPATPPTGSLRPAVPAAPSCAKADAAGDAEARSPSVAVAGRALSTAREARRDDSRAASSAPVYPLVGLCRAAGLPEPVPEYQFHKLRKWRADYAWPLHKIIVEIDGGLWINGGHSRGVGRLRDMEKDRAATLLGWRTLRYAPDQLGQAIADLRIMFAGDAA